MGLQSGKVGEKMKLKWEMSENWPGKRPYYHFSSNFVNSTYFHGVCSYSQNAWLLTFHCGIGGIINSDDGNKSTLPINLGFCRTSFPTLKKAKDYANLRLKQFESLMNSKIGGLKLR